TPTPNPSPQGGGEFSFLSDKSETVAVGRAIPARRCAPNRWRQAPSRRSTYAVTAAFVAGIHLAACSGVCGWLDPGHKARNDLWEAGRGWRHVIWQQPEPTSSSPGSREVLET